MLFFITILEKRVAKALKICRKYLTHVQNSVFEGEVTQANYEAGS